MKKLPGINNRYTLFAPFVNNKNRNRYTFYEPEWLSASHLEMVETTPAFIRREYSVWEKLKKHFSGSFRVLGLMTLPLIFLVLGFYSVQAQSEYSLKSVTGSVSGTSTLHDWKSAIKKVQFKGDIQTDGKKIKSIKDVEVTIPVKGIVSTEGKGMDKKTYKAFKSDKNPLITYTFKNAVVKTGSADALTIEASGKLTMAGVTQPEDLTATGKMLADGDLELKISKKLKMTTFKMQPPKALLGTIKSGDEITLDFVLVLTQSKTTASK